jgi:hypothetical protein
MLTREGTTPLAASGATVLTLLAEPAVAVLLGAALGVASLLVSRASARLVTPEDPMLGFARMAIVSTARMLVVVGALAAYFVVARDGFAWFAITLVASFLATLAYEAFKTSSATRRFARAT